MDEVQQTHERAVTDHSYSTLEIRVLKRFELKTENSKKFGYHAFTTKNAIYVTYIQPVLDFKFQFFETPLRHHTTF